MKNRRKRKTIKSKLVISYIILAVMVACVISIVDYVNIFSLTEKQTYFSIKTIETISRLNSNLHVKYLSPFAKEYVILKAESVANDISYEIESKGGYKNINDIKHDPVIREIINQPIKVEDQPVGNIILINNKKDIILAGNYDIEGKNYQEIKFKYPDLYKLVDEGTKNIVFDGYYEILTNSFKERRKYLAAVKIPKTPLFIIAAIHVNTYIHPVFHKLKIQEDREINHLLQELNNFFNSSLRILLLISIITLAAIIIVSLFISNILAKTIASPILKLRKAAEKLAKGNFNILVKEEGTDEIIQLAQTFNHLGKDLQNHITKLKKEISQREQLEGEISAARKIQKSQLPIITEEFIRNDFSLYADLVPAKNVAGDFYDFFYLNEAKTKIAILIGDVSGKGVPAAFFMGVAKTIIKNAALSHNIKTPGKLLSEVNNILFINNTEAMFVSLFLLYYNTENGNISFANAGHHPALKIKNDSTIEEFGKNKEPLLGIFKDENYSTSKHTIQSGESIVLFTDGITEAFSSKSKKTYENSKLIETLLINKNLSPKDICKNTFKNVISFQDNILFDDITMLILKNNNTGKE